MAIGTAAFESALLVSDWNPAARDENIDYVYQIERPTDCITSSFLGFFLLTLSQPLECVQCC